MIDVLLSLPTVLGSIVFMGLTAGVGLTVYFVAFQLLAKRQAADALKEIREATSNLFRVVGWLFSLLLSLTFTEVVREVVVIDTAVEGEAAAISDTYHNLKRFDLVDTRDSQALLVEYTEAIIEDDWTALAQDRLGERASRLLRQLEGSLLTIEATDAIHQTLMTRVVADVDRISDHRLTRLQQAQAKPPPVLPIVIFGYLVTMVCFGVYRPRGALVALLSLYTVFVGVVIYLILAMSDPFEGATPLDPAPLEYVLETMRAGGG